MFVRWLACVATGRAVAQAFKFQFSELRHEVIRSCWMSCWQCLPEYREVRRKATTTKEETANNDVQETNFEKLTGVHGRSRFEGSQRPGDADLVLWTRRTSFID